MFDVVIGLGQAGSRIASCFQKVFKIRAYYLNFARVDFSKFKGEGKRLLVSDGGTGRNPFYGKKIAASNKDKISEFVLSAVEKKKYIAICVGGGGGSGCGMIEMILSMLIREKKRIVLIYTLPEKKEKLPAKPNALRILNNIIEKFISEGKVTTVLVDNEYAANKYKTDGFRFEGINRVIPKAFKRFWNISNLSAQHNYIDFAEGYNSLDENELKRAMYFSRGFTDIRIVNLEITAARLEDNEIRKEIKTSSLFIGSFDINTSKIAVVVVALPEELKGEKGTNDFVERLFIIIGKMTKAPYVFNSSYYDKRLKNITINILLGGLIKSKSLTSLINQAIKDKDLFENKGNIEKLDLTGV